MGDYIQGLAARQFLPHVDSYADLDHLDESSADGQMKLIMNGWFMHLPQNWPPPSNIKPLFVSFHLNHNYAKTDEIILRSDLLDYFRSYQPIGCRDIPTRDLFHQKGIDAYFSGCLTLTFPKRLAKREDLIVFVDAFPRTAPRSQLFSRLARTFRNTFSRNVRLPDILLPLHCEVPEEHKKIVPGRWLEKSVFIGQLCRTVKEPIKRYAMANAMLELYSRARLVVTTRLHCALPCLALGTPVVFLRFKNYNSDPRFDGYRNMWNSCDSEKFLRGRAAINWDSPRQNPIDIDRIAGSLRETVRKFVASV